MLEGMFMQLCRTGRARWLCASAGAVLVLLLALFLWFLFAPQDKRPALLDLLVAYRTELAFPGPDVETAATNLANPDKARAFVRNDIAFVPYEGRRQTPEMVLQSRIANGPDKVALLGALLEHMGWNISYILPYSHSTSDAPATTEPPPPSPPHDSLTRIARLIEYDMSRLEAERQTAATAQQRLRDRIMQKVEAAQTLLETRAGYDPGYGAFSSAPSLSRRIIISAERDGQTRLFDPVFWQHPLTEEGSSFQLAEPTPWQVDVRIIDATGFEQSLLVWEGPLFGQDVHLNFIPAIDPLQTLAGPVHPRNVPLWQPVLQINGTAMPGKPFDLQANTPGLSSTPPISGPDALSIADPATATGLSIEQIDATDWPRIRLGLDIKSTDQGSWIPAQFELTDNGTPVTAHLLGLEQTRRPIQILTDVSISMQDIGAFELSKQAIIRLIGQLDEETPVGLTSFAMEATEEIAISPLRNDQDFIARVHQLQTRYYTGIYGGLAQVAQLEELAGGIVVLLSDGQDNVGGSEEAVIAALREKNIRVFAIALGADADDALLKRIALATGGRFAKLHEARELNGFYARLGAELSSRVLLEYDVPANINTNEQTSPDETQGPTQQNSRFVEVALNGTTLEDDARYSVPRPLPRATAPRLILRVQTALENSILSAQRTLVRLDSPGAAMQLTGDYALIGDLGGYPQGPLTIAYLDNWIKILRQRLNLEPETADPRPTPDFARMRLLNAFRSLSGIRGENGPVGLHPGPNLYLLRNELVPSQNGFVQRTVFDTVLRAQRSTGDTRAGTLARMEMASAIAEGLVISGENGIDALVNAPDIQVTETSGLSGSGQHALPAPAIAQVLENAGENERIIHSPQVPDWLWQMDMEWEYTFRALYWDGAMIAKGASLAQTAHQFDMIDKMYAVYDAALGNYAGMNPVSSAMLSAIASFKRQENKLWCYSALMLGLVGEAVEEEDALLNRSAQAASARAARLCRIQGGQGNAGDMLQRAFLDAAADGLESFAINLAKETESELGTGLISQGHSAWSLGGALHDAASTYFSGPSGGYVDSHWSGTPAPPPIITPMTPGFHRAIGRIVLAD